MSNPAIEVRGLVKRFGSGGFARVLHAEWTKFRTVRGWIIGMGFAALLIVLLAVLTGASAVHPPGPAVPLGPGGEPVTDSFYFVHRPLDGNGSITVPVTSLTDMIASEMRSLRPGTVPWAKAGILVEAGTSQGSPYAAIMVTSSHGVRMQYDYTHDTAGRPGAVSAVSPRWLRLTRSGGTITGYDSADGTRWAQVGSVHLAGLSQAVQAGLFVASPPAVQGQGTVTTVATAVFGHPSLRGRWPDRTWTGAQVGAGSPSFSGYPLGTSGMFTPSGGSFTVTGAGDIAPAVRAALGSAGVIGDLLAGSFAALIAVTVVGTMFITAEYRLGLIRTTLAASPLRGQVLVAKALVLGVVTFVAGLAATVVAVPLGERLARANGMYMFPVTFRAELRVEAGTAAMLAGVAILALAVGTVLRHAARAVTAVVASIVLPYLLVVTPFLPVGLVDWLTRVTPAAAFAVQQTLVPYPQVSSVYTAANGYYPLAPWAGLAVLCGYAAVALGLAAVLLRRRDA